MELKASPRPAAIITANHPERHDGVYSSLG
jgi:hypothetical protein